MRKNGGERRLALQIDMANQSCDFDMQCEHGTKGSVVVLKNLSEKRRYAVRINKHVFCERNQ